jgi:hypothetical protein
MIHSIGILTSRDGMMREGNEIIMEMIPEENCKLQYGRIRLRTWKVI